MYIGVINMRVGGLADWRDGGAVISDIKASSFASVRAPAPRA